MNSKRSFAVNSFMFVTLALVLLSIAPIAAGGSEEFVGPFASWADVKRDFHAVGDGVADDTFAFQRALDTLRTTAERGTCTVLFVPSGTYRLTSGLTMTSHIYVAVIGEDPARTTLRWDGPDGGVMLFCNGVRYSKFGRLTWDGRGKALSAISHQWNGKVANANSGCEHADEVFKDVGIGLRAGIPHFMDAECSVQRCRFEHCSRAGISIESMNALDWWVWHCSFEGCRVGATNCADGEYGGGHFHIYESVFRGSTEADMTVGHASYFGIRNNTSIGSKAFFVAKRPQVGKGKWAEDDTWGGEIKLQGNRILDPQDSAPIRLAQCGPLTMLDNVVRGRPWASSSVVEAKAPGSTDVLAVGNTFTVAKPFAVDGRLHELDTRTVRRDSIHDDLPTLPGVAPRRDRRVFEVPVRSGAAGIQSSLDEAAKLAGQRPVVHLSAAVFYIEKTLVIPAGSDLQLVGDGEHSSLRWVGRGNGPVIHVAGPSQATLSDLSVWGGATLTPARGTVPPLGILVDGCDQPGARIWADQLRSQGMEFGVWAGPLRYATVQLTASYPGTSSPQGVMLRAEACRVSLFGGATGGPGRLFAVDGGGQLLVRDAWYEGPSPRIIQLTGSGAFTLDGSSLYCSPKGGLADAPIAVDGFRGPVTFLGVKFSGNTWMSVKGDDSDTRVLFAGSIYWGKDVEQQQSGKARLLLLNDRQFVNKPKPGTVASPEKDVEDAVSLRDLLAQDREGRPEFPGEAKPGVTSLRFHRVWLESLLSGGVRIVGDSSAR